MSILRAIEPVTPDLTRMRFLFVNFFFLGDAKSWVLVDAGLPGAADMIMHTAEERFGKGARPKAIILTHGHFDHIGALKKLLKEWPVPVFAHPLEISYLTGQRDYNKPDPRVGKGMMARLSFAYPYKAIDISSHIKTLPADGSVPFMPGWRTIHTPGHTEGHVSFFRDLDRCLIAGDAFVTTKQESFSAVAAQKKGVFGPPAYFTPDWTKAKNSVATLVRLRPKIAVTGHGQSMRGPALEEGLADLLAYFDSRTVPHHGKYVVDYHPKTVEAEEAEWLRQRQARSNEAAGLPVPEVAAAPLGTDQEAAGAITTPAGRRKYDSGQNVDYAGRLH